MSWKRRFIARPRTADPCPFAPDDGVTTCTLDRLERGCTVCLHRLECRPQITRRLAHFGVIPGVEMTLLQDGGGPLLVAVGDTRIAIGREVARGLCVSVVHSSRLDSQ